MDADFERWLLTLPPDHIVGCTYSPWADPLVTWMRRVLAIRSVPGGVELAYVQGKAVAIRTPQQTLPLGVTLRAFCRGVDALYGEVMRDVTASQCLTVLWDARVACQEDVAGEREKVAV